MPRKTKYELEAERSAPDPNTEAYWRLKRTEASAKRQMLDAQHRKLLIDKMNHDLIPRAEVREVFSKVFAAYRQATREVERRYGADAGALLVAAERSALRTQREEEQHWDTPPQYTPTSGTNSAPTTKRRATSPASRKKRS
jgi:hypothetical protein